MNISVNQARQNWAQFRGMFPPETQNAVDALLQDEQAFNNFMAQHGPKVQQVMNQANNSNFNPMQLLQGMMGGNGGGNPMQMLQGLMGGNGGGNPLASLMGGQGGGMGNIMNMMKMFMG